MPSILPVMMGVEGLRLTPAEKAWRQAHTPLSAILFSRNIESPAQVRALCEELAALAPEGVVPLIAVDQEGGRVQRLTFGGRAPAMRILGDWYGVDKEKALEATELVALLLAAQVREVGATWVMAPCVDLAFAETHAIIGDRSFGADPATVTALAAAHLRGTAAGGCLPCLKHAPGHGRATADSHVELPRVEAGWDGLRADMAPYAALAKQVPFVMTAHVAYAGLGEEGPATYAKGLWERLRAKWDFGGLLLADDLGMQALGGSYDERAVRALEGGCDVLITSFSKIAEGMAGTVWDRENAAVFARAVEAGNVPMLAPAAEEKARALVLPPPAGAEQVRAATARLHALWADGPARMGYALGL